MVKLQNLCFDCPVRGKCCYISQIIHGYNVIIDNQPCWMLDAKTGLCKDFSNRTNIKHCLNGRAKFGKGGLPAGCLYLRDNPDLEPFPKIDVMEVVDEFTRDEVNLFNILANHPDLWKLYYEKNEWVMSK